jgi:hypothetical protein
MEKSWGPPASAEIERHRVYTPPNTPVLQHGNSKTSPPSASDVESSLLALAHSREYSTDGSIGGQSSVACPDLNQAAPRQAGFHGDETEARRLAFADLDE